MMVSCMCILSVSIGGVIGFGRVVDFPIATRIWIAVFSFILAFLGFYHTVRNQKTLHIDISALGQLRLMEVNVSHNSCQEKNRPYVIEDRDVVRLLKDSTIWSNLMLLRLQAGDGKITVVPVLHDCVSRDGFRALSVACRWLVARNSPDEHKNL